MLLLIVAGNETTRTMTSQGMRLLMEHPEQYRMMVEDPTLIPDAVEEILRFNPAVINFRRTVTQPTEVGGQALAAGDKVVMFYQAASRDEAVFENPDCFDITAPAARGRAQQPSRLRHRGAFLSRQPPGTVAAQYRVRGTDEAHPQSAPRRRDQVAALELHPRHQGDADEVRRGCLGPGGRRLLHVISV
ncbi:MAG: cytochrome P450 [Gammaproteobacteria bacterium]|nr:cytochrome P450 [Gammaproteobacteria bacterium]